MARHQKHLREWQMNVHERIEVMEDSYLKETSMGNIIRGFDQDTQPLRFKDKAAKDLESEKERLFSSSNHSVYQERQKTESVTRGV